MAGVSYGCLEHVDSGRLHLREPVGEHLVALSLVATTGGFQQISDR